MTFFFFFARRNLWRTFSRWTFALFRNAIIRLSLHKFEVLEKFRWDSSTNDINTCRNHRRSIVNISLCLLHWHCERFRCFFKGSMWQFYPRLSTSNTWSITLDLWNERLSADLCLASSWFSFDFDPQWKFHFGRRQIAVQQSFAHRLWSDRYWRILFWNEQRTAAGRHRSVDSTQFHRWQTVANATARLELVAKWETFPLVSSRWKIDLSDPHFVRILDIGSYVYTFFREIALEHLSCGTVSERMSSCHWPFALHLRLRRTFTRAWLEFVNTTMERWNSAIRFVPSRKFVFSARKSWPMNSPRSITTNCNRSISIERKIFSTARSICRSKIVFSFLIVENRRNSFRSGLAGSAICIYTVDQLQRAFSSSFLTQKTNESFWLPSAVKQETETVNFLEDDRRPSSSSSLQCDKSPSTNEIPLPSGPVLRSGVLQSSFDALTFANLRISHLLIDYVDDVTILFVITFDEPSLRKYSLLSNQQLCFLEQLQLRATSAEEHWRVNKAELIGETVKNPKGNFRFDGTRFFLVDFREKFFSPPIDRCWNSPSPVAIVIVSRTNVYRRWIPTVNGIRVKNVVSFISVRPRPSPHLFIVVHWHVHISMQQVRVDKLISSFFNFLFLTSSWRRLDELVVVVHVRTKQRRKMSMPNANVRTTETEVRRKILFRSERRNRAMRR